MNNPASAAVEEIDEITRIMRLPRRAPLNCQKDSITKRYAPTTQALVEFVTEKYSLGLRQCGCGIAAEYKKQGLTVQEGYRRFVQETGNPLASSEKDFEVLWGHPCLKTLKAEQAWTLYEAPQAGGIHGYLSVGSGKTVCFLLLALVFPDCKTALLLAKSTQRIHYRHHYLRLREHFKVPSIVFDDAASGFIIPGMPVLHFFPYSRLQRPESTVYLERLAPNLVLADESHCIARESSRTNRVKRFFASNPARLCDGSGSLIKKGVCDTYHLSAYALGDGSPQPLDPEEAERWGVVVDPSNMVTYSSPTARRFKQLFAPNSAKMPDIMYPIEAVREGLRDRLRETLGVITTKAHAVDCSLNFHKRDAPKMPPEVAAALMMAREGTRPDDVILVEPMEIANCVREVGCGFHSYWAYPRKEPKELRDDWFEKRKNYFKELRAKLKEPEPYLDSPDLCYKAAERAWRNPPYDGDLPMWKAACWPAWHAIKDQVKPDPRTAWIKNSAGEIVGDWLAKDAAKWAHEHKGVVWTESVALGRMIAKIAKIPYHGGGPDAEKNLMAEKGDVSIVASLASHGESRDGLQRIFSKQLYVELTPSGDVFEQRLGRLLREGQKEDSVETWVYQHIAEFKNDLKRAIELAEFIYTMSETPQWLLSAHMDFEI